MKKIVFINSSNFPYGLAVVEKLKLIANGLYENGYNVYLLSMYSTLSKNEYPSHKKVGKLEKALYIYTSGRQFNFSKIGKLLFLPLTMINEYLVMKRLFRKSNERTIVIHYLPFILVIWYYVLAKLLNAKFVVHMMEYNTVIKNNFNSKIFDRYVNVFTNGAVVISEFLKSYINKHYPKKRIFVLPVTANFKLFDGLKYSDGNYSLFCASAGHLRIFKFVINAFSYVKDEKHLLYLVANGSSYQMNEVSKIINDSSKSNKIRLFTQLEYKDLLDKYSNARILLIPLNDDERDRARFPHKIGEYTASRRPILSTKVGEIPYYFKDSENAFISDEINEKSFGSKIDYILQNPELAENVAKSGYQTGIKYFDYQKQGVKLAEFFSSLYN